MKLKIGELARRCGLSIRTLHHYDAIGLLCPSQRTPGGARLYGHQDFCRLHRIQVLKGIGYSLDALRRVLDDDAVDALAVIDQQARLFDAQARHALAMSASLKHLSLRLTAGADAEAGDWLSLLEMTTLYGQHLSDDELQLLRSPRRGTAQGIEAQRSRLVAAVADCMRQGVPPAAARARGLAWRWVHMVIALTSNDAALAEKLRALQQRNQRAQDIVGINAAMLQWIDEAIVHARVALFSKYLSAQQTARLRELQLAHRNEWPALVALVRAQMAAGTPCNAEPMQRLAARWRQLFCDAYCGNDAALGEAVRRALAQEPRLRLGVGVDDALLRYLRDAGAITTPASA